MDLQLSDSSSDAADEEFWNLANSSSDEELLNMQITALQEDKGRRRRRGSISGRIYKDRQRLQGHQTLYKDYFAESPVHGEEVFRRRFRMHIPLFLRILDGVKSHDSYFVQKRDRAGRLGLSTLQKGTAAIRMLAYGIEDERAERRAANDHESLARQYVEPDEQIEDVIVSKAGEQVFRMSSSNI